MLKSIKKRTSIGIVACLLMVFVLNPAFGPGTVQAAADDTQALTGAYGNYFQADSLGNLDIGRFPGEKVDYRFTAQKTGTVDSGQVFFPSKAGYYAGTGGKTLVEIRANDASNGDIPDMSSTALGSVLVEDPLKQMNYPITFDHPVNLVKGQIYHILFTDTDPDGETNYTSIDDLYINMPTTGLVQPQYSDEELAVLWQQNSDIDWTVKTNHSPIFSLHFTDGSYQGQGLDDSSRDSGRCYVYGSNQARQNFTVSGGDRTVSQVNIRLGKTGTTSDLTVTLKKADGTVLQTGTILKSKIAAWVGPSNATGGWTSLKFPAPVTLQNGVNYYLEMSSPASTDTNNCFVIFPLGQGDSHGYHTPDVYTGGYAQKSSDGTTWQYALSSNSVFQLYFSNDFDLSDLKVDGATISGFSPDVSDYKVYLPHGAATLPQVTSAVADDPNATVEIKQADFKKGRAEIKVTSKDNMGSRTYTLAFIDMDVSVAKADGSVDTAATTTSISGVRVDRPSIDVTFNRPMDHSTLNPSNILFKKSSYPVDYDYQIIDNADGSTTYRVTPKSYFINGTSYFFYINSGVRDTNGNRTLYADPSNATSTKALTVTTANDKLYAFMPVTENVPVDQPVEIRFTGLLDLNKSNIYKFSNTNVSVGSSLTYLGSNNFAAFFNLTGEYKNSLDFVYDPNKKPGETGTPANIPSFYSFSDISGKYGNYTSYFLTPRSGRLEYNTTYYVRLINTPAGQTVVTKPIYAADANSTELSNYDVSWTFTTEPGPASGEQTFTVGNISLTDFSGNAVTALTPSGFVQADVTITNTTNTTKQATLIIALYDSQGAMKNFSAAEKQVSAKGSEKIKAMFSLPSNVTGYHVKAFVWNNLHDAIPLSDAKQMP